VGQQLTVGSGRAGAPVKTLLKSKLRMCPQTERNHLKIPFFQDLSHTGKFAQQSLVYLSLSGASPGARRGGRPQAGLSDAWWF
jgi:hypothetical protein